MKAVILAGGKGSRLREVSNGIPKPMVEVGGRPIIWHIMSHYASYGFKEFVICLGYNGYQIKDFFLNYSFHNCNLDIKLSNSEVNVLNNSNEDWSIKLIDTGLETMTGGRIKRVQNILQDETFFMTYGDAVSNVNIDLLLQHHKKSGKLATVTAVSPQGRFGVLSIDDSQVVTSFSEKPKESSSRINGGFFVLEPNIFDFIRSDETIFEQEPLNQLCVKGELNAYIHEGFWQCMDTPRDWELLENLSKTDQPPWTQTIHSMD